MTSFDEAVGLLANGPFVVPEDWQQGRTVFGGVIAAAGVRRACALDPGRPVRSVNTVFVGPVDDGTSCEATLLRRGGALSFVRVDFANQGELRAAVTVCLGDARELDISLAPKQLIGLSPPEELDALPFLPGLTPNFVQHMDLRLMHGAYPFSGVQEAAHGGWSRHKTTTGAPVEALLGLIDAWPAPALMMLDQPAPASSVSWSVRFCDIPESIKADEYWYLEAEAEEVREGYVPMRGRFANRAGVVVALFDQLVAVYSPRNA